MGSVLMKLYERCNIALPAAADMPMQTLACAMFSHMIDCPEAKWRGAVTRYVLYCWISGDLVSFFRLHLAGSCNVVLQTALSTTRTQTFK